MYSACAGAGAERHRSKTSIKAFFNALFDGEIPVPAFGPVAGIVYVLADFGVFCFPVAIRGYVQAFVASPF
jgi:hypothetical protein